MDIGNGSSDPGSFTNFPASCAGGVHNAPRNVRKYHAILSVACQVVLMY